MPRSLALVAALLPALAAAQVTVTETSNVTNGDDEVINIAECKGTASSRFAISWRLSATAGTVSNIDVRVSDTAGCPLPSTSNTAKTKSLGTFTGTSGNLPSSQSASSIATQLGVNCEAGTLTSLQVCAVALLGGTEVANATQTAQIQLDTQTPGTPRITSVTAGDRALDVSWESSTGANRYRIDATPQGTTDTHSSPEVTDTSRRISGLTNGTPYDVRVVALSLGGNPSAPSDPPVVGTPVEVQDFWRLYTNAGGREQGGCSTGGPGGLAALALALLALRRRRS